MALKSITSIFLSSFAVFISMASCQMKDQDINVMSSSTPSPATETTLTMSSPATSIITVENEQIGCLMSPTRISTEKVNEFQWNANSQQIFYRVATDGNWYSYDVVLDQTKIIDPKTLPVPSPTSSPGMGQFTLAVNSPSGNSTLLVRGTPSISKVYLKGSNTDLEVFLGTIRGQIRKIDWFDQEKKVLIALDWQSPAGIAEGYIYIADLPSHILQIEIPKLEDYANIEYKGMTPDESNILFVSFLNKTHLDRSLKLWSIKTNQIVSTPLTNPFSMHWISDSKLMAVVVNSEKTAVVDVVLYDFDTMVLTKLSDSGFPIALFLPNVIQFSPDGSAIAYIENDTNILYWTSCKT